MRSVYIIRLLPSPNFPIQIHIIGINQQLVEFLLISAIWLLDFPV